MTTYAAEAAVVGRAPVTVVEIDLDKCANTFGVAPCTASAATGFECHNTRVTCADAANYNNTATLTIKCIDRRVAPPPGLALFPILESANTLPARVEPGKGLGVRAKAVIRLRDFSHHDRGIDPYVSTRTVDPASSGTFWGKLLARNPYYQGRALRVRRGYILDPWDWTAFEDHNYVIDQIDGPDRNGVVTVTAVDVLALADPKRAKCPVASVGELASGITDVATTATLDSGSGASYGASGTVRIGSELATFTRSGDTLTLTRAQWGSTAAAHSAGAAVQECAVFNAVNPIDATRTLLTDYTTIPSSYIDTTAWNAQRDQWLSAVTVTRVVSKPTDVAKLVAELTEQVDFNIAWNDVTQKIDLKVHAPPDASTYNVTEAQILRDSVKVQYDQKRRLSQVWIYYNKANQAANDDPENYLATLVQADLVREGADLYDESRVHDIRSNWLVAGGSALQVAGRLLRRYQDNPRVLTWRMDARDAVNVGILDLVYVSTRQVQGVFGTNLVDAYQVLSAEEIEPGSVWEFVGMTSGYSDGNYGFIGPSTLIDYLSASEADRQSYAFIANSATGLMSNGDDPYLII